MGDDPKETRPAESSAEPDETEPSLPAPGRVSHTIESLHLNLEAAEKGRTWELLPKGFRAQSHGSHYPLPTKREDLQRLALIPIPPYHKKRDSGCLYLRRVQAAVKEKAARRLLAVGRIDQRLAQLENKEADFNTEIWRAKKRIQEAAWDVKAEAKEAIASLTDLFELGRQGLDGQMRAHINGGLWKDESIDAKAFRECFKMVLQGVAKLGLPSGQREKARKAAIDEVEAALKKTREAVALSAATKDEETPQ